VIKYINIISVQFSLVTQSCPTLCDPMNRSTPGLPVYHQLPEFTETHVHRVSDAIQPSHPLSSPSPPAPNPSQHQSLFQWVNSSHEVAKVLENIHWMTLLPVPIFVCVQAGIMWSLVWKIWVSSGWKIGARWCSRSFSPNTIQYLLELTSLTHSGTLAWKIP